MNKRRTRDEIQGDVLHLLNDGGGPYTISQVRAWCSLTYPSAQNALVFLIESGDVIEFWGERDTGHYCAQYAVSGGK